MKKLIIMLALCSCELNSESSSSSKPEAEDFYGLNATVTSGVTRAFQFDLADPTKLYDGDLVSSGVVVGTWKYVGNTGTLSLDFGSEFLVGVPVKHQEGDSYWITMDRPNEFSMVSEKRTVAPVAVPFSWVSVGDGEVVRGRGVRVNGVTLYSVEAR